MLEEVSACLFHSHLLDVSVHHLAQRIVREGFTFVVVPPLIVSHHELERIALLDLLSERPFFHIFWRLAVHLVQALIPL